MAKHKFAAQAAQTPHYHIVILADVACRQAKHFTGSIITTMPPSSLHIETIELHMAVASSAQELISHSPCSKNPFMQ